MVTWWSIPGVALLAFGSLALGCNDDEDHFAGDPVATADLAELSCAELGQLAPFGSGYNTAYTLKGTTLALSWPPSDNRTAEGGASLRFGGVAGGGVEFYRAFSGGDLSNVGAARMSLDFGLIRMEGRTMCFGAGSMARPLPNAPLEIRSPLVTFLGEGTPVESELSGCNGCTSGASVWDFTHAGASDEVLLLRYHDYLALLVGPDSPKPTNESEVELRGTLLDDWTVYAISGVWWLKDGEYAVKVSQRRLLGNCDAGAGTEALLACRD